MGILTRAARRELYTLLVTLPVLDTPDGRDLLLADLPPALCDGLARAADKADDLAAILDACDAWTPHPGAPVLPPLCRLLANAQALVHGTVAAAQLLTIREGLSGCWPRLRRVGTMAGYGGGMLNGPITMTLAPDGQLTAVTAWDDTLRVLDLRSREVVQEVTVPSAGLILALTPDGRQAFASDRTGTLRVWDLASQTLVQTLAGHFWWVRAVVVTPEGDLAVSGSRDGTVWVWDLRHGVAVHTLHAHSGQILTLALTAEGRQVLAGGMDGMVRVWDLASGALVGTLAGHRRGVTGVAATPDGRLALSASYDRTLRLWDLARGRELARFEGEYEFDGCALAADGRIAAADAWSGPILLFRIEGL